MLTVGVCLLPDSVHDPVGLDPQEEAAVFTVQPFGILEAPGRKTAAAAVFRCGWKCCDPSRGHLLLLFPLLAGECFLCWSRAGAPSEASHLPLFTSSPPPPDSSLILLNLTGHFPSTSLSLSGQQKPSQSCGLKISSKASRTARIELLFSSTGGCGGAACGSPSSSTPRALNSERHSSWIRSVGTAFPFGPQFACALGAPAHMLTPTSTRGFNQPRS